MQRAAIGKAMRSLISFTNQNGMLRLCILTTATTIINAATSNTVRSLELLPIRIVGTAVVYIDSATIERTDGRSQVWSLWNYASDQLNVYEEPYQSVRFLNDYDCEQRTVRIVEVREYSEAFGRGSPLRVYGGNGLNERSVPRGSLGDEILERICSP